MKIKKREYIVKVWVKEKESRRNQVIYTVNTYHTKSSLLINGPQTIRSYANNSAMGTRK